MKTYVKVTSEAKNNPAFEYFVPIEHEEKADVIDILELAFRETNRVNGDEFISKNNLPCCSSSVGHMMEINNSIYLICGIGFKLITQEAKDELIMLPTWERTMNAMFINKIDEI